MAYGTFLRETPLEGLTGPNDGPLPFTSTMLHEPYKVPEYIREFHGRKSPNRKLLMDAFLGVFGMTDTAGKRGLWDTIFKEGLVDSLVGVMTDKYEWERARSHEYTRRYLTSTTLVTRTTGIQLCDVVISEPRNREAAMQARALLDKLAPLWTILWKIKLPVFDAKNEEINKLSRAMAAFLDVFTQLRIAMDGKPPSSTIYPIAHVALYIWIFGAKDADISSHLLSPLTKLIDGARPAVAAVLKQAVLDTGLTDRLAEQLCYQLRTGSDPGEPLKEVGWLLNGIAMHRPEVLHAKLPPSEHSFIRCITLACQRQLCQGTDEEETGRVISYGLATFKCIIQGSIKRHLYGRNETLDELVDETKVIHILARASLSCLRFNDSSHLDCLRYLTEIYAVEVETLHNLSDNQGQLLDHPEMARVEEVERKARDVWLPTLLALRAVPPPRDTKGRKHRAGVEEMWRTFGRRLGLDEQAEARRQEAEREPMPLGWPKFRGCRWRDCLCCRDPQAPHRMRVCRGCWSRTLDNS